MVQMHGANRAQESVGSIIRLQGARSSWICPELHLNSQAIQRKAEQFILKNVAMGGAIFGECAAHLTSGGSSPSL